MAAVYDWSAISAIFKNNDFLLHNIFIFYVGGGVIDLENENVVGTGGMPLVSVLW